jgi:hypothetical protein
VLDERRFLAEKLLVTTSLAVVCIGHGLLFVGQENTVSLVELM